MDFDRIIETRRSLRAFSDRPVEPEKIGRMLEAVRRSPSNGNRQPWRFVVVEKGDPSRAALEEALDPGNAWAKKAPVLIVSGGQKGAAVESREYHLHDSGLALMSLLYRAVDLGLMAHPMAGWKEAAVRSALSLPDDVHPAAIVAVGYRGRPEELDEETRRKDERPNTRKALGEIAFRGRWGEPFPPPAPGTPAKVFEADMPLRFRDIDAMGHVNNSVMLTFLETARMRFFADVLGARRIEDIDFILAEARCRYRLPIRLEDPVRVRMRVTDVSRSSFRFLYEVFDPRDRRVFAEAETVQVSYDYAAGRSKPLSKAFIETIGDFVGG